MGVLNKVVLCVSKHHREYNTCFTDKQKKTPVQRVEVLKLPKPTAEFWTLVVLLKQ